MSKDFENDSKEVANFDQRLLIHYRLHLALSNSISHSLNKDFHKWLLELYNIYKEACIFVDTTEDKFLDKLKDLEDQLNSDMHPSDLYREFTKIEVLLRKEMQKSKLFMNMVEKGGRIL